MLGFDENADVCAESFGDAAEHGQVMAFVGGRFQTADVLLRGVEFCGKLFLGKTGLFAQRGQMQGHVPRLARLFEPFGESGIPQLFFQVPVEIGFTHASNRFSR